MLLPTLLQGASTVLLRAFDPAAALDFIERYQGTFLLTLDDRIF
jgi:hypothetical protein